MIDVNPAKVGVDNPVRRRKEQHPFESSTELETLAAAIREALRTAFSACNSRQNVRLCA